jgi:hypothetical protein
MVTRLIQAFVLSLLILAVDGCATAPAVPMGNDTYMISQTSAGGVFRSMSSLKTSVIERANAFAASKGKVAIPLASKESPAYPGHMPNFEYQFRLVDKNDPRAEGGALLPRPDMVVEMHQPVSGAQGNAPSKTTDVYTELLKLDDLRKRGIISDSEFESQKQKILSGG